MFLLGPGITAVLNNNLRQISAYSNCIKYASSGPPSSLGTSWQSLSQLLIHTTCFVLLQNSKSGMAHWCTTNETTRLHFIHWPTKHRNTMARWWKISEAGRGKTCGMQKPVVRSHASFVKPAPRQGLDLLPRCEVRFWERKTLLPEKRLCGLSDMLSLTTTEVLGLEPVQTRVQGMRTGRAEVAEVTHNGNWQVQSTEGKQHTRKLCKDLTIF